MSGYEGCAGEDKELCLGKHHHPGHPMDLAVSGEDQENMILKFLHYSYIFFPR